MSEFTPWKVETNHYGEHLVRGVGGEHIAKVNWLLDTDKDIARLIAAAPDLLELVATANHCSKGSHTTMWQERARAVLAKAKGEPA